MMPPGEGNKGLLNVVVCSTLSVVSSIFMYQRLENLQIAGATSCGTLVPDLKMSIANLVRISGRYASTRVLQCLRVSARISGTVGKDMRVET